MSVGATKLAGALITLAGAVILMGVISAEALYPAVYTTHDNEISDLGATRPPNSVILQPSARIFNLTMIVSGSMILAAAVLLQRVAAPRRVYLALGLLGAGLLGVGVFPGNVGSVHPWFAFAAFVFGGIAAVTSARMQPAPARYLSGALGLVTLASLGFALIAQGSALFERFGDGGVERWIAYPAVLWLVAFGGFLGSGAAPPRDT